MVDATFNGLTMVEIIQSKIKLMLSAIESQASSAKEALNEVFKFAISLLIAYPDVFHESFMIPCTKFDPYLVRRSCTTWWRRPHEPVL